jgi:ribosomal protein S27AE
MVKTTKSDLKEKCPRCVTGTLVTDHESGEMLCPKCGFVLKKNL